MVVTDGPKILNVSEASHSDLFWALRGGGANYGIVTGWEFRVYRRPLLVTYGSLRWGPTTDNLAGVLRAFNQWQPWLLPQDVIRVHVGIRELAREVSISCFIQ